MASQDPNDDLQLWVADLGAIFFFVLYSASVLGLGFRLFRFTAGL